MFPENSCVFNIKALTSPLIELNGLLNFLNSYYNMIYIFIQYMYIWLPQQLKRQY